MREKNFEERKRGRKKFRERDAEERMKNVIIWFPCSIQLPERN